MVRGAQRSEQQLKESAQTATRRRKGLSGKMLVGFQVALSHIAGGAAGLFARTLIGLNSIDPGFKTDHLLLVDLALPNRDESDGERLAMQHRIDEAIAAVPGVRSGAAMSTPYLAGMMTTYSMVTEAESADPARRTASGESWPETASLRHWAFPSWPAGLWPAGYGDLAEGWRYQSGAGPRALSE